MIHLKRQGVWWELAPEFEPLLEPILRDAGEIVKQTDDTKVSRHRMEGRAIYVKWYASPWYRFSRSVARSEWEMAQKCMARSLPVVKHLAIGERRTWWGSKESWLITEAFEGVRLDKFPDPTSDELQAALARYVLQLHQGGVLQDDLHHNVIVRANPIEVCRIDLDRGQIKDSLSHDERLDNLARINIFTPLTDVFFRHYGLNDSEVREVRRRHPVFQRELCAHRAKRCRQRTTRFQPVRAGGLKWWVRRDSLDADLRQLLERPVPGNTGRFVVQRSDRALDTHQTAFHLELLGIPAPRTVAAAQRRWLWKTKEGYLITERIPVVVAAEPEATERRRAELIARLEQAGFSHRDLGSDDFQLGKDGQLYFFGLDKLRYSRGAAGA